MTNLESEIISSIKFLENFSEKEMLDFIKEVKFPLLIGAMGSSYYLPSGRSMSVADEFGLRQKIRFILASEEYCVNSKQFKNLLLISNSGETREILGLAKKFQKQQIFAVTSNQNSPLSECAGRTYILKSGKEKAVAATKSIVEQSILCENLIRYACGQKTLGKADLADLAIAMKQNIEMKIPSKLQVLISGARTIYFAGGSCGVGEELALKFSELGKKKAKFIPGSQILHGPEEVIEKGDVIFLLFADKYKKYFDRFIELKQKTGAYIFAIGADASFSDLNLSVKLIKNFKPYCILAYFWNILTVFAKTKGYSLDKGDKISKIGVRI